MAQQVAVEAAMSGDHELDWAPAETGTVARFSGANSYDVREAESLLAPYEGEVVLEMLWIVQEGLVLAVRQEETVYDMRLVIEYEYRPETGWSPVRATRCTHGSDTDWNCNTANDDPEGWWLAMVERLTAE